MSDRRWRIDLTACGLLGAWLLLAVAVCSHDPADLPGTVYPINPTPHNLLGLPGAYLANGLFRSLGAAVHVFLAGWLFLTLLLFVRRSWWAWSARLFGWLLLVTCAAVAADRWGTGWLGGFPGGTLGAWLAAWLEMRFQPVGILLLLAGGSLLGTVLALDQVLVLVLRAARFGVRLALNRVGRANKAGTRFEKQPRSPTPQEVPDEAEEEEPSSPDAAPEPRPLPRTIPINHHDAAALEAGSRARAEQIRFADFELPPLSLLEDAAPFNYAAHDQDLRDRAALLEKTFADFGLNVRVVGINTGPVITQYEIALETGLRVHKVTSLTDDLALNLKVPSVRMVAPIPGKNTVGVEIPNEHRADVRLKEVILASGQKAAKCKIPLFLGKDSEGRPLTYDLADMPHLLIAGRTGTGKSVCMNAIILSMLMTRRPDEVKMVMIDPKVVELGTYNKIPHLMHPVVGDMRKAEAILAWAVDKMEERYDLLSRARVRNIAGYNELDYKEILRRVAPDEDERDRIPKRMPYIVLFVDEMADLILQMRKEVEGHIIRLTQKSRAAGIHLVVATQKPTVDVITGLIKSNLPARICFKVVNRTDSRVVLDEMGADKLLGKGDMLYMPPGVSALVRAQGTYASDAEINKVVEFLECDPCYATELMELRTSDRDGAEGDLEDRLKSRDPLYEQAIELVIREGRGSVSLLQRVLGIGYGRAGRMIGWMAEDGIVGAYNGSNAREVLYTPEQWAELRGRSDEPAA
jgi:S-DNA-T family DNA segregation ATPase FtsK/SpoIIIE